MDEKKQQITVGVSVFPAGVDETDEQRGAPKNQKRREKRSLRRSLARRALRKRNYDCYLLTVTCFQKLIRK